MYPCIIIVLYICIPCTQCGYAWHISDLHIDTYQHCSTPVGDYHCDSPLVLALSALHAMKNIQPYPDLILWTGDSAPHWSTPSMEYILNITSTVFTQLEQLFPGVPVIPVLGNHDTSPPNQFPVPTPEDPTPQYYSHMLHQGGWGQHVPEGDGVKTFLTCGYYVKTVKTVKYVVLNTNIYLHDNYTEGEDPCGQLAWLNNTLVQADSPLYIVSHVPPKMQFTTPTHFVKHIHNKYMEIVTNYDNSKKIYAHLYAHYHSDTFELFLDEESRSEVRGVAYIGSSVSPITGVNPGIRLFKFDDDDRTLLDYDQYYLDLQHVTEKFYGQKEEKENSNTISKKSLNKHSFIHNFTDVLAKEWKLLYSATEFFSIPRLSQHNMFTVFTRMVEQGATSPLFLAYCHHSSLGHGSLHGCGEKVWREQLCTMSSRGKEDYSRCVTGSDKNSFPGYTEVSQDILPTSHGFDLDNNGLVVGISAAVFLSLVTFLLCGLYLHHRQGEMEGGEHELLIHEQIDDLEINEIKK